MAIITSPPTARRPPTFPGLFVPPVHLPFGPNFLQHPPPDYSPISPASTTTLLDVPAPTASPPPPLDVIAPSQPIALNTPLNVPGKEKVKSGLFASIRGKTAVAKDTLDLVFAESLVFIVPPRQDKLGLGMGDAGVDGDGGGKDVSSVRTASLCSFSLDDFLFLSWVLREGSTASLASPQFSDDSSDSFVFASLEPTVWRILASCGGRRRACCEIFSSRDQERAGRRSIWSKGSARMSSASFLLNHLAELP